MSAPDDKASARSMPYFRGNLQVKLFGRFRSFCLLAAGLTAILPAGCATAGSPAKVAPSADVSADQAWHDAKLVAGRGPGRTPAVGTGTSMAPVYGDNTMLVISPIAYGQLQPGMIVAYRNRQGTRVVHRLVEKLPGGWRVMGLNNERVDADLVTPANLIGVIYASFNYDDEPPAK
jgi:hypothetical protein